MVVRQQSIFKGEYMGFFDTLKNAFGDAKNAQPSAAPKPTKSPGEIYLARLEAERAEKDYYLQRDPYSPIEERASFSGLNYYPPDPRYHYTLPLRQVEPEPLHFQTSTGDDRVYLKIGTVAFEVEDQPTQLTIYKAEGYDELFLPFRDVTSGGETYGAGRYLEPLDLGDGQIVVDFNLAYNPYCAYSEAYSCPLPPVENWLKVAIRAGEKKYK
jgi:hypothetical protein